jgi:hypothetical protein
MVQHIDKDFLKNPQRYSHAQDYWSKLWERLVLDAGAAGQWRQPWLGAPPRNGDPIFSAVSPAQGRGVRVIQHEPTSHQLEIVWWTEQFGEEGIDEVVSQLVISCALSAEAAKLAYDLLLSWVTQGTVQSPKDGRRAG